MKLVLVRIAKKETYTIGKLFIDGEYFCDTLEDKVRAKGVKIYGETAIDCGVYKVIMNISKRFQKLMPLLLDVPNFAGIRIHAGNTPKDTLGCILVGKNSIKGKLTESKIYTELLYDKIFKAKECTIEIK